MKTKKITFATPGFSATMREITQIVFQRAIECPVGWQHFYDAITGNVGATLDEAAAHVATLCPKYESVTAVLDDVYVKPVGTTEERIAALEARCEKLEDDTVNYVSTIERLERALDRLEGRVKTVESDLRDI